jgi:nucleoside-diphosphate-sugar epimerase
MKLLVTGASGFLGGYVVAEAARRGHDVRAAVRRMPLSQNQQRAIEMVKLDLRSRAGLAEALGGIDAVIHLAAAKKGDLHAQLAATVVGTENLLWAMTQAGTRHIVHISSFSVYEPMNLPAHALLDEAAPLIDPAGDRDEYAVAKVIQERLVIEAAKQNKWRWTILRPGMLYGPGYLFNARVGLRIGERAWLRTGSWARIPLTYVENCAEAIVLAVEKPQADGQILNIVDDQLPRQHSYARLIAQRSSPRPRLLPVSWTIMRTIARCAWLTNRWVFGGRGKLPGIFVPSRLHARCKPLRYSNARAKSVLGWSPRYGLLEALDRGGTTAAPDAPAPAAATAAGGAA